VEYVKGNDSDECEEEVDYDSEIDAMYNEGEDGYDTPAEEEESEENSEKNSEEKSEEKGSDDESEWEGFPDSPRDSEDEMEE
jgi:hypothetical protein